MQIIYKPSRPSTRTSFPLYLRKSVRGSFGRRLTGDESVPIIAFTNNHYEEGTPSTGSLQLVAIGRRRRMKYPKYLLAFTVCNVVLAGSAATPYVIGSQDTTGQRSPMAEEVFKNVQILKGIPVDQFMSTMGFFSASLGLNCTDCHVEESASNWTRYADDNARKQMARRMMLMVNSINKTNFAGRQVVTCNTCHRGNPRPNVMPSLDLLYSSVSGDEPVPVLDITGQDLDGVKLESEVSFPARIKQALTNWRTGFPTLINGRETNIVQGTTANGGTATLCFDVETGLLVRLVRFSNSPVGRLVTRVDYSDYREVAGVKMPFKWTVTWLDGRSTYELMSVQPNVAIDTSRFAKPAPSRQ